MPVTFLTFAMGYLAIIGFPGFSGFWSKDKIIETAFDQNLWVGLVALAGAGITAFYMTRLMILTFISEKRWSEGVHPHESPEGDDDPADGPRRALRARRRPAPRRLDHRLARAGRRQRGAPTSSPLPAWVFTLIVLAVVAAGVAVAWFFVAKRDIPREAPSKVSFVTRAARNDLYGDALNESLLMRPGNTMVESLVTFDDNVVDGFVDGTGSASMGMSGAFAKIQTGYVRSYALSVLAGALLVVLALLAVNLA